MKPLPSTPWDGLIPTKHKVPTLTLVHTAKTTFVNGVNPFTPPPPTTPPTIAEVLRANGELSSQALYRAVVECALHEVNKTPGTTAAAVARETTAERKLVARALRKLAKSGDIESTEVVHEGVRKYMYWPKGTGRLTEVPPTLEQKVVLALGANPGMGGRQIADAVNSEAAFSMLAKLVKGGRVHVEGKDRARRYYVTDSPAPPKRRLGGKGSAPTLSRELVLQLREDRAAGVPWNTLIQQYRVGQRAMFDAVKGIGAYRGY